MRGPLDELTRARRVIERARGSEEDCESRSAKAARRAGETFVAAALRGEDLTPHVPSLLRHIHEGAQEPLLRALVVHYLRPGTVGAESCRGADEIRGLLELPPSGARTPAEREAASRSLGMKVDSAIDFAAENGLDIAPVYPLLARRGTSWVLGRHLDRHPERIGEVLAAISANRSSELLPNLLRSLAAHTSRWSAWPPAVALPLATFVMELLDSQDERDREAAAQALTSCAQYPNLDLTTFRPRLEAALTAGRSPRAVSMALTSDSLGRTPPDWNAVERLLAHPEATVRDGAVQVLAWRWSKGRDDVEIVARLAAALLDGSPAVRNRAAETLAKAHSDRRPLPPLEPRLVERLVAGLADPDLVGAAGDFLDVRASSDPGAARQVMRALESRPADPSLEALARKCRDLLAARDPESCPLCIRLQGGPQWGESLGEPDKPPPPELTCLRRLATRPKELYRCPHCGTYYSVREESWSWLDNDWTRYSLERLPAPAPETSWALTHELTRIGDLGRLDRELLRDAGDGRPDAGDAHPRAFDGRRETLDVLKELVYDGLDIGPLEPTLRGLLAGPLARAAADVLTRHWIRTGRPAQALELLGAGDPDVLRGALDALWHTATRGERDVSPYLERARELTGIPNVDYRPWARGVLVKGGGLRGEEGPKSVAAATRSLDSEDPGVRRDAALLLDEAAEAGLDIGAAIPRLGALLADDECAGAAAEALLHATWEGANVAPLLPRLIARVRKEGENGRVVGILKALQDDGVDVSSAFGALRPFATPGTFAKAILEGGTKRRGK